MGGFPAPRERRGPTRRCRTSCATMAMVEPCAVAVAGNLADIGCPGDIMYVSGTYRACFLHYGNALFCAVLRVLTRSLTERDASPEGG